MASTKVIATTWAKKDLVTKLKATLKRMDAEINEYEKEQLTLKKRQEAWQKKASAWVKKNIANATSIEPCVGGYKGPSANVYFDKEVFDKEIGEYPSNGRRPDYKDINYSKPVSDYDQVLNAIALIEGSTDTEYKINTTSVWASFIR
jgi:hypothetical protein